MALPKPEKTWEYGAPLENGLRFESTIDKYKRFDVREVRIYDDSGSLIRRHTDTSGSFETLGEAEAGSRKQAADLARKPK